MKSLLHFFLLSITILFYIIPAIHSKCVKNQQLSLLDLKESLTFDSSVSSKLISWNASIDCCSWIGVTCSTKGLVVGLDISNEFISSSIDSSSSLFHLQHLQSLNLACNDFNGSKIPAAVGKLTNLKYLNLSSAEFFGQIPIEISELKRLVVLDMSENYYISGPLTLEKLNLRMLVKNLTQLTELYLDVVPISAEGTEWCQAISSTLPNLRVLSLSNCALSGPFHKSLAELQSLSVVRLDDNKFMSPVPGFFANFSNLTFLGLSNCELQGTFPNEIFQVPSLVSIHISNNLELHGSLPLFSKNNSLQSLAVRGTSFSGVLPVSIGNLMQLSTIDISDCDFTGSIPSSVGNLTQLVHLEMSENIFHGPIDSIHWESLTNLLYLALDSNLINGRLPSSIFFPPLLEELLLSHNQLSGQIPIVSNMSSESLNNLDLSRNNLAGPISASFLYLQGLRQVNLSSNNFSDFPFHGPQQLRNLKGIDLSHNSLLISDESNSSSSTFPQIEILVLSSNKLSTFPHILRNHSRLYYLDLSENQMQGEIPKWIWGLNSLQHLNVSCNSLGAVEAPSLNSTPTVFELDLHSNQFQGQIPIFLPFATYLDYSRNHFSSSIPSDIGTFISSIVFISLSRNKLYGTISESICNIMSNLEVLDLSHNSLSGLIPECLTTMSISGVLNLRGNKLSGSIPDSFLEDCGLKTLDLSENHLEGHVPKSLANCTSLEVLNLGYNQIADTFPCSLKEISTLVVLVLRSNKFHGGLECSKIHTTWPSLQVIDLSHNFFSGGVSRVSIPSSQTVSLPSWPMTYGALHLPGEVNSFGYMHTTDKYFEDAIKFTSKGLDMELVKIFAAFTLIDFSCNKFSGSIPEYSAFYTSLHIYNLSNNEFTGEIPSSFGYMHQLESLDLSQNHLTGKIPQELAQLAFLSFLNLSNNKLVGRIPTGTQFSTFPKASFVGNKGLWGPPLDTMVALSPPALHGTPPKSAHEIDWDLIIVEMGYVSGIGIAIASLFFCERWRRWYYRVMFNIVLMIIPQLEQRIGNHRRHVYIDARRWRR